MAIVDEPSSKVAQEKEEEPGEPVWLLNLPGQITLKWYPHP
jgi:hypothetical protein